MVADRLVDNKPWSAAGYSGNHPNQFGRGYLHVAPAKPGTRWETDKFKRLLETSSVVRFSNFDISGNDLKELLSSTTVTLCAARQRS